MTRLSVPLPPPADTRTRPRRSWAAAVTVGVLLGTTLVAAVAAVIGYRDGNPWCQWLGVYVALLCLCAVVVVASATVSNQSDRIYVCRCGRVRSWRHVRWHNGIAHCEDCQPREASCA